MHARSIMHPRLDVLNRVNRTRLALTCLPGFTEGLMRTEKETMPPGELYDTLDPQLCDEHCRARLLFKALNDTRSEQIDERMRLIKEPIPSASTGI